MNHLLLEIKNSGWSIRAESISLLYDIVHKAGQTNNPVEKEACTLIKSHTGASLQHSDSFQNPFDSFEEDSVVVIPINGVMTKYSSWFHVGTDDLARYIRLADKSERINGIILLMDTPGGSVQSVFQLQDAICNSTKPIVTLTDGYLCSAGYWVAAFTHKIFALNDMNIIGSIGVMSTLVDDSEWLNKVGIKVRSIYPPESKFKNLPVRKAVEAEPDDTMLIQEQLSPLARKFQEVVKSRRKRKLDTSIEGLIEGKEFYAGDAKKYGLIDGIKSLEEVSNYIKNIKEQRDTILSNF